MTDDERRPPSRLASAESLEPRIQQMLEFVLSLAEGREPPRLTATGRADAIEAIGVALNLLAETSAAERQQRQRAEELLRDEREAYDEAADLLCSVTPAGELLKVNATFTRAVQADRTTLPGRPLAALFAPTSQPDLARALEALTAGEPAPAVDLELLGGARKTLVRLQGSVSRDAAGAPTHLRLAFRDVTSERELEGRLLVAQQLEALGRLAGGVAHDFNNLLQVMRSAVAFLAEGASAATQEDVVAFNQAADAAAAITRQMLTFARRDVVRDAAVEVKPTLERAAPILARLAGDAVSVRLDLDDAEGLWVPLDEGRLQQLVVNLVINARDAMPGGGAVRVHAGPARAPDGLVAVRLTVDDQGPGVPLQLRHAIFEPFFTTKALGEGTGLGLATVHGIVAKAGGSIDVQDAPAGGARFVLQLPRAPQAGAAAAPRADDVAAQAPGTGTILVVEDDELVRALTCRILRTAGFRVLEAGDRPTALARAAETPVDLVVADVLLRADDGPSVVRAVLGVRPRAVALYVSGYARDALGQPVERDAFLQKPFTPAELLARVRGALAPR